MQSDNSQTTQKRDLYIKGYFTDRALRGDVPMYGYPSAPLLKVSGTMTVVTGYLAALRKERANAKA